MVGIHSFVVQRAVRVAKVLYLHMRFGMLTSLKSNAVVALLLAFAWCVTLLTDGVACGAHSSKAIVPQHTGRGG